MFIRTKVIKGNPYAYLVRSKYTKKGVRQKISRYLGRVLKPDAKQDISFQQFMRIDDIHKYIYVRSSNDLINDMARWELKKHSIGIEQLKSKVIAVNDGYLCNFTINRIKRFKPGLDQRASGIRLASLFVEAGIKIPEDAFVHFFQKLFK